MSTDKQESSVCNCACVVHITRNGGRKEKITQHCEFGYFALAFPDHVCTHAHVFPGIALPSIRDHQLPSADLGGIKVGGERLIEEKTATLESKRHL